MNIYDVFTTPEEGERLRKCGIPFYTASFASIRNSPMCDYSIPVVVPSVSKTIVERAVSADSDIVIPVWCLNDLMQILIDKECDYHTSLSNNNSKRARIESIVECIEKIMQKEEEL